MKFSKTRVSQQWQKALLAVLVGTVVSSGGVYAQPAGSSATPAVVYGIGGKFDKGFNQSAYEGAEAWKKKTGKNYAEFSLQQEDQFEQAAIKLAERGSNPVVLIGFAAASGLEKVAPSFPKTQFYIVDMVVNKPNVRSVAFREHEGSFLMGALAAMKTTSNKVGFVGGMDIPLVRRFACGYEQGAKYINPNITVIQNMTGTTPAAWNNPSKGKELARSQMSKGVDVVFAAAGGTSVGVLQAMADAKKFSIGVDINQNYLHPGSVLTSMVKRVDLAVTNAFESQGTSVSSSVQSLGIKEGGVDWTLDEHNRALITPAMEAKVKQIKADVVSGKIKIVDYMANNKCQ